MTSPVKADHLAIYLNDHLAAAAGGVSLARRIAGSRRGEVADEARRLAGDIADDRASLLKVIERLGVRRTFYKEPVALIAERLGRWKPNGAFVRRSPLSDVIEYEALALGISGKRGLWGTLRLLATTRDELDAAEFEKLIARADEQLEAVERLRVLAIRTAFAADAS